jgi:hypothetical protein
MYEGDFVDVKKVASGGYFHLLQAPFGAVRQKKITQMHRFDLASWLVWHMRHIG